MLNLKVIGAGAAGNKAAINLIEKGFNKSDVLLINSTAKDIPENYRDISMIFGANTLGGCGKEREIGKQLILSDMKDNKINLDNFLDPNTHLVVITASTEGGSGSAAAPILAKYFKEVLGIPVVLCMFFGFNTDVRGMQNSIELCQEFCDNYGVIGIANSKFVDEANNNYRKAESLANDHFVDIIKILNGSTIKPSSQNIDDTDLFKIVTTPGYMRIESAQLSKIKNIDQFNKSVQTALDESKLMECKPGAKRAGYIFDISENISDAVDYNIDAVKQYYGMPYEIYTQVQYTDQPNSVSWIVSGLPLPLDEIQEIYDNYLKTSGNVNKNKDDFFDSIAQMKGNQDDAMFNMLGMRSEKKSKDNFFSELGIKSKPATSTNNVNGKEVVTINKQDNTKKEY